MINVGVIGCGLIGQRRIKTASGHPQCSLKIIADVNPQVVSKLAQQYHCMDTTDWQKIIKDPEIDIVVISTPNHLLAPIGYACLTNNKHVLIEKPMGKNLPDALKLYNASVKNKRKLKIGFNHRYHPAIYKAYQLYKKGIIGKAINVRAQYGHGGRKGYEKEWRGNPKLAGGGELTDQGVHLIDLIQWFCGQPHQVFSVLQTAFWPIAPSEDNGFALLKYKTGLVANFHSTWTQWKNLFNFEIFGTKGSLCINGLGGSYGPETLTIALRKPEGGVPDITKETFDGADDSWKKEWDDFVHGIQNNKMYLGTAEEGLAVMKTLDALYKSHRIKKIVDIK